jgi:hypothetical protein
MHESVSYLDREFHTMASDSLGLAMNDKALVNSANRESVLYVCASVFSADLQILLEPGE